MATNSIALPQENFTSPLKTVASATHTIVLIAVITAWSWWGYFSASRMRDAEHPHRVAMYLLTMLWEWSVVAYIFWGVKKHGVSARELIGGRWNSAAAVFKDMAVAAGFWIIAVVVLFCAAIALHVDRSGRTIGFMLPQSGLEIFLWLLLSSTAGFCEEVMFRGYFQRQFKAWTGNIPAGVVLSAAAFGAGHIYQGVRSATVIFIFGLLFSILAEMRKSLRPGMLAHGWQDGLSGLLLRLVKHSSSV